MTRAAKVSLLAAVLVILAYTVGQLRSQFGPHRPPSVNVGDDAQGTEPVSSIGRLRQQPTILRANPAGGAIGYDAPTSPRHGSVPSGVEPGSWLRPPADLPPTQADPLTTQFDSTSPMAGDESWPVSQPLGGPSPFRQDGYADILQGSPVSPATGSPLRDAPPQTAPKEENVRPERVRPESVRTEEQDSFWDISVRAYGVGDFYRALYYHNRQRVPRPDQIPGGLEIATPHPDQLRRLYPGLCPDS